MKRVGLGRSAALAAVFAMLVCVDVASADTVEFAPGIVIDGDAEFIAATQAALERLERTPTGASLLAAMGTTPHTTTITEIWRPNGWARAADLSEANIRPDGMPSAGSDSTIGWNSVFAPGRLPAEVILGHELIHALHHMQGIRDHRVLREDGHPDDGTRQEELRTVGVAGFDGASFTENLLRADWNDLYGTELPVRTTYASLHTPDDVLAICNCGAEQRGPQSSGNSTSSGNGSSQGSRPTSTKSQQHKPWPGRKNMGPGKGDGIGATGALEGALR